VQSCRSHTLRFSEPVKIANKDGQHKSANEDSLVSLPSRPSSARNLEDWNIGKPLERSLSDSEILHASLPRLDYERTPASTGRDFRGHVTLIISRLYVRFTLVFTASACCMIVLIGIVARR